MMSRLRVNSFASVLRGMAGILRSIDIALLLYRRVARPVRSGSVHHRCRGRTSHKQDLGDHERWIGSASRLPTSLDLTGSGLPCAAFLTGRAGLAVYRRNITGIHAI